MTEKIKGIFYTTDTGSRPVEEWLAGTSPRVRTKLLRLMNQLEEYWGRTHLSFVKPVKDNLFEISTKVDGKWPRVIFFHYDQGSIVYLHGFLKKTNKTPKKEIDLASERRRDFYLQEEEKSCD